MIKTIELLGHLSVDERMEFSNVIKTKSEKSFKLFQYLLSLLPDKRNFSMRDGINAVYPKEKKFKNNDVNIRKLLSSLSNEILSFLAKKEILREVNKDVHLKNLFLLKAYASRGMTESFDSGSEEFLKCSETAWQHEISLKIINEWIACLMRTKQQGKETAIHIKELCVKAEGVLKQDFVRKQRHLQKISSYYEYLIKSYSARYEYSEIPECFNFKAQEWSDDYSLYLYFQAKAFQHMGDKHIEFSKVALDHLEKCAGIIPEIDISKAMLLNNIAIHYSLQFNFKEANSYFRLMFDFARSKNIELGVQVLRNYLSSLMHDDNDKDGPAKALDFYNDNLERIESDSRFRFNFYFLVAGCHLHNKNAKAAQASLNKIVIRKLPDDQKLYCHYLRIIASFQLNDVEGLDKDLRNLNNCWMGVNKENLDLDFNALTQVFIDFAKVFTKSTVFPNQRKPLLQKLKKQLIELFETDDLTQKNYFPLKLLLTEIRKLFG